MRLGRILKIVAVVVVALVVAAVAVLMSLDVGRFKGVLEAKLEEATGRDVTLAGDIDLALGLTPAIVIEKASLANAAWGSRPQMVSVDRLEAEIALLPALQGDIQVLRLVLVKPDILLESNAKGQANWEFKPATAQAAEPKPAPAEPATAEAATPTSLPSLRAARIEDATLTLRDASGEATVLKLDEVSAEADGLGDPLDVVLKGALQDAGFDLTGRLGPLRALTDEAGKPYPVALKGTFAGIDLSAEGTVAQPMQGKGVDLAISVQADDWQELRKLAAVPDLPAVSVKGRLSGGGQSWTLADLTANAGPSSATGRVAVSLGGARPKADVALQAALVDLGTLLPEPEAATGDGGAAAPAQSQGGSTRVFSSERLPLDALKAVDATFDVQVAKLVTADGIAVEGIAAKGSLQNGRLSLTPVQARLGDGTVIANATVDASSGKAAAVQAKVSADAVILGKLFEQIGKPDLLAGVPTDATIDLATSGASMADLMGGLNGAILVKMGEGRIHNALIDWAGADIVNQLAEALNPLGDKDPHTALTCGVVNMAAKGGVLTWDEQVAFETTKMNVVSTGAVDLGREQLDIAVRPYAKGGVGLSAGKLAEFVRLRGSLSDPKVGIDEAGVAKNVLSLGAALATGGTSLLAEGILDRTTRDSSPCATALGAPRQEAPAAEQAPTQEQQQPAPANPVDMLKKGLGGLLGQ